MFCFRLLMSYVGNILTLWCLLRVLKILLLIFLCRQHKKRSISSWVINDKDTNLVAKLCELAFRSVVSLNPQCYLCRLKLASF